MHVHVQVDDVHVQVQVDGVACKWGASVCRQPPAFFFFPKERFFEYK